MGDILDSIENKIIGWLRSAVEECLTGLFDDMTDASLYANDQLEQTPETWNSGIFALVKQISIEAIVPIAVIILSIVICHEFITQLLDKSIREMDIEVVAKMAFKLCFGIFIMNHVFDITMGIFQLGQQAVRITEYVILGETGHMGHDLYGIFEDQIKDLGVGQMLIVLLEAIVIDIITKLASIIVIIIVTSRMIEIYIYCSISPLPFATLTNREWGNIGQNFLKNLFALAFQAFAMMLCLGIHNGLINNIIISNSDSLNWTLLHCTGISIVVVLLLWKCGSISKSIFNAI